MRVDYINGVSEKYSGYQLVSFQIILDILWQVFTNR